MGPELEQRPGVRDTKNEAAYNLIGAKFSSLKRQKIKNGPILFYHICMAIFSSLLPYLSVWERISVQTKGTHFNSI